MTLSRKTNRISSVFLQLIERRPQSSLTTVRNIKTEENHCLAFGEKQAVLRRCDQSDTDREWPTLKFSCLKLSENVIELS